MENHCKLSVGSLYKYISFSQNIEKRLYFLVKEIRFNSVLAEYVYGQFKMIGVELDPKIPFLFDKDSIIYLFSEEVAGEEKKEILELSSNEKILEKII